MNNLNALGMPKGFPAASQGTDIMGRPRHHAAPPVQQKRNVLGQFSKQEDSPEEEPSNEFEDLASLCGAKDPKLVGRLIAADGESASANLRKLRASMPELFTANSQVRNNHVPGRLTGEEGDMNAQIRRAAGR